MFTPTLYYITPLARCLLCAHCECKTRRDIHRIVPQSLRYQLETKLSFVATFVCVCVCAICSFSALFVCVALAISLAFRLKQFISLIVSRLNNVFSILCEFLRLSVSFDEVMR